VVHKALGSSTTTAACFCSVVSPRFLSTRIKAFHHVSQLQPSSRGGDTSIVVFAWA